MGDQPLTSLSSDGRVAEFVKDQYRHCKPILVIGAGASFLDKAGIPKTLPSGKPDPGLVLAGSFEKSVSKTFVGALAEHRHFERETDPPRV